MTPDQNQHRDHGIGVVVIGRNEGERLRWCLESALKQATRVVYVDSGSSDDSVSIARELGVEVVPLDPSLPFTAARARNEGIDRLLELSGEDGDDQPVELVQVVDGDCELMPGWIEQAHAVLASTSEAAIVCGRRWERYPRLSVYNKLCDLEWDTPVGEVRACGGDALIRIEPFRQVGGFNAAIIAGEEPELCVRLRQAGHRILRIDHDMTVHDAQMTRFGQWWRRMTRCGHAYAEGRAMHGALPERFRGRQVRSALWWGLVLPLIILGAAWPTWGISFAGLAVYGLLMRRVRRQRIRHGDVPEDAMLYARYCVLGKFPQALGVLSYYVNRWRGRGPRIIEYKGPGESPRPATPVAGPKMRLRAGGAEATDYRVLYVGATLPGRSQTFVYREVLGLRQRGMCVLVASVHPPERGLGDPGVEALAEEAVPVYGLGVRRMLSDAAVAMAGRPRHGLRVLVRGTLDALVGRDVPLLKRPRVLWQVVASLALAQRCRQLGIHHVHAHLAHVPATIAMYAANYLRVPFSFTGHAVDLFSQRTLLRQKLRRAAFIACISEWHRSFYRRTVARAERDLPLVRCGVDVEAFAPAKPARKSANGLCRILTVGRMVPKKGFDVLIEALSILTRDGVAVECRIIGDGPEMPALRRQRIEQGVSMHVELLGARTNDEVHRQLDVADVFVLPCRIDSTGDRDGIPVVLIAAPTW